ncbi:MAG TPA: prolipoprotein diacylglyceryl transferase family protein [Candidatus Sulfotelmatobacter sp.]|nr:prolipoprotein diacylglyceryl transferase family protein [Candidatus Sulfotelmatobacter sp.]
MNFIFFVILFCFFIFLYVLYYFAKDDFVIIRKDISLERVFNLAFLTGIIGLLSSRVGFAIFSNNLNYLNPVVFLAFPYFPGFSLTGGIIGMSLFTYFYSSFRKMPVGRIIDLFTMSFITVLPFSFIVIFIISLGKTPIFFNIFFLLSLIIYILFAKIIYPYASRGEIKDGSLGLVFLSIFSFLYFIVKLFLDIKNFSFLETENIALLILLFSSLIILINQEIMDKFLNKK